ncbi:MAG: pre-peptidase C-terminal domain-containing protein, partial [Planctomycetota bacterium]|nr:pre-peptidase C-terminal domain-containing protein [Planctomycetota bacterium]
MSTTAALVGPTVVEPVETAGIFDISNEISLATNVRPFNLGDVVLYVSSNSGDRLYTANAYQGGSAVTLVTDDLAPGNSPNLFQDIVFRSDATLSGYRRLDNDGANAGAVTVIDPGTGALGADSPDLIADRNTMPQNIYADNQATTTDYVDALTYERTGYDGNANVPVYALYYAVREADVATFDTVNSPLAINSKLYRANPADGTADRHQNTPFGVKGDIQLPGVTKATSSIFVFGNDGNANSATIQIEAKEAGLNGNGIRINFFGSNQGLQVTSSLAARTITVRLNVNNTGGVTNTAQQIVDAINGEDNARRMVTAGTANNSNLVEPGDNLLGGTYITAGGVGTPLKGYVTGLAFADLGYVLGLPFAGTLYGVTSAGEFLTIDKSTGQVTNYVDLSLVLPDSSLQGLTVGPQNVASFDAQGVASPSYYKNMLFAVSANGYLVALNTSGVLQTVFDSNGDGLADATHSQIESAGGFSGLTGLTGLAFSPLDFNLWHPTMRRGDSDTIGNIAPGATAADIAGHGINQAFDLSRTPSLESRLIDVTSAGTGTTVDIASQWENEGGASFYFGLEDSVTPTGITDFLQYYSQEPVTGSTQTAGQYGVANYQAQRDLTSSAAVGNNYNLPGGALGSLVSGAFSLDGYSAGDKPTLYFNYFLDTENAQGTSQSTAPFESVNAFRDSARAFISKDGGITWELIATNNSELSAGNVSTLDAELPRFISDSATEGLASTPAWSVPMQRQQVQELFDNSGSWRQARVDLSNYAGADKLMLRFDFSTAGSMNDLSLGFVEDANGDGVVSTSDFGEFSYLGTQHKPVRNLDNAHEGFYIDDIIVGFSERGEMVTQAVANDTGFRDLSTTARTTNTDPFAYPEQLTGTYQLEIRRSQESAVQDPVSGFLSITPYAPLNVTGVLDTNARLATGYTLVAPPGSDLQDGTQFTIIGRTTQVFEFDSDGLVAEGHIPVPFSSGLPDNAVALNVRNAVNGLADFGVTALMANPDTDRVDLIGAKNVLGSVPLNLTVTIAASALFATVPTIAENGGLIAATVTREGDLSQPLVVTLSAVVNPDDVAFRVGGVLVTQVTIPAGAASVTFDIVGVDDLIAEGTQTAVIQAFALGFTSVTDTVDVLDDETPALTISIAPGSVSETDATGAAVATITRNTPTDRDLTVTLASLDPSEVLIYGTIMGSGQITEEESSNDTILSPQTVASQWSLAYDVNIGDKTNSNTSTTIPHVTISGTGDGSYDYYAFTVTAANSRGIFDIDQTSGPLTLASLDLYDGLGNPLSFAYYQMPTDPGSADYYAGAGFTYDALLEYTFPAPGTYIIRVSEYGSTVPVGSSYQLHLSVENMTATTTGGAVQQQVTFPAGSNTITVKLVPVQDFLVDGNQTAAVVAFAPGWSSVQAPVAVRDSGYTQALGLTINTPTIYEQAAEGPVSTTATVTRSIRRNEIQQLTFDSTVNGGSFTLTYDGNTSANIFWSVDSVTLANHIQTALNGLFGAGNTIVASLSPTAYTIMFQHGLANANLQALTANSTNLQSATVLPATVLPSTVQDGAGHEVQQLTVSGFSDSFTLSYNGEPATLANNATYTTLTAADVQAQLNTIPTLAANVDVIGAAGGPFTIVFQNALAGVNAVPLVATVTGVGTTAVVATIADGGLNNEIQQLNVSGFSDSFRLSYNGVPATLANNAPYTTLTAADVQTQLNTIPTLAANVAVTGAAGGPFTIVFQNALAGVDALPLVAAVTGVGTTAVVTTIADGVGVPQNAWVVTLVSTDTSEATLPASVTIPAGLAAVSFTITAFDDGYGQGVSGPNHTFPIAAYIAGIRSANATLTVVDSSANPPAPPYDQEIQVLFGTSATTAIAEDTSRGTVPTSAIARLQIPSVTAIGLNANITFDPTQVTLNGNATGTLSMTIPAGQSVSANITVAPVNPRLTVGDRTVLLTPVLTGSNEVQQLTFGAGVNGGSFTISYDGNTSVVVWNVTPLTLANRIQTALNALFGAGNTTVASLTATDYTLTFQGNLGGANLRAVTTDSTNLLGGVVTVSTNANGVGNEVQTLTPFGTSGGTFTLSYGGVFGTTVLTYDTTALTPTAAQVLAHLNSIPALNGNVTVLGAGAGPFTVVFRNVLAGTNVNPLGWLSTAGTAVAVGTLATGGNFSGYASASAVVDVLDAAAHLDARLTASTISFTSNEVQQLTFGAGVNGGTFTITYDGNTSANIDWSVNSLTLANRIQTALDAIFGAGNTSVASLSATNYRIAFQGNLGGANLLAVTTNSANLTGGVVAASTIANGFGNEVQTLTLSGVSGGTVTLSYGWVLGTTPLIYDTIARTPTAAQVLAHLNSIPALNGNVTVLGTAAGPFTVVFRNILASTNITPLAASGSGGTA